MKRAATETVSEMRWRPWLRPSKAEQEAIDSRLWLSHKVAVGRDGCLLYDGDYVYVVNHGSSQFGFTFTTPIQQVDYFHCFVNGSASAQMHMEVDNACEIEPDVSACEMIHLGGGFAKAVRCIQRLFRASHVTTPIAT